jgi:hypothetical protein
MHTDPRVTYEFDETQVETAAAIVKRLGRTADAATAASTALDGIRCPAGAQIEAFGLTITEALTNANATKCIVAVKVIDKEGGSTSTAAQITVPSQASDVTVANARAFDGTPSQAECVAAGARLLSSDSDIPYTVPQGGIVYVEVTQAAGAAGGAVRPFLVIRQNGQPNPGAKAKSPVLSIAS